MQEDILLGAKAKIARSREIFQDLNSSVYAFLHDKQAHSLVKEFNSETSTYSFFLQLEKTPPIPTWQILVGDCFHNARTALDHLFWALIKRKHPEGIENSRIKYPFLKDRGTFLGRKPEIVKWVGSDVAAMIENTQPFNHVPEGSPVGYRENDAFLFIHKMDILDKHKQLVPILVAAENWHLRYKRKTNDPGLLTPTTQVFLGHFQSGTKLINVSFNAPDAVEKLELDYTLGLVFEDPPNIFMVCPSLHTLIDVVEGTIGEFEHLF